jgi:uncharacterized protein YbcC (UPF0753/DUF2309 family)
MRPPTNPFPATASPMIPAPEPIRHAVVSEETIQEALDRIPPLWPLAHFVAVNPFVGLAQRPFAEGCETHRRATGSLPLLSAHAYRQLWLDGAITPADLDQVCDTRWTREHLLDSISRGDPRTGPASPTFADFLDAHQSRSHWGVLVVEEISKWCAVAFDRNQTIWGASPGGSGFYPDWKAAAAMDRNPEAFGLRGFRRFVAALPGDSLACIRTCLATLSPQGDPADFLHRSLSTVSGWAGHLQYRVREDAMRGRRNDLLRDLLAVRLAFDAALKAAFGTEPGIALEWAATVPTSCPTDLLGALIRWQRAYEHGYQRTLAGILAAPLVAAEPGRPSFQAVFCIDVRSEVFRRHLEAALPGIRTVGFAGFFGFPVAHRPVVGEPGSRCPVLLVPPVESQDAAGEDEVHAARLGRAESEAWRATQYSAASCFSFVETVGLGFIGTLNRPAGRSAPACGPGRPVLGPGDAASVEARATMAEGALRNMGLTRDFARLVLVCGHGSRSANNPYASGLDCGACGGHAGDVNARLAADALNDPGVRAALGAKGIRIPMDTWFVAGLHNTTIDTVTLFEDATAPDSHIGDLLRLRTALTQAGMATRRERAGSLGIGAQTDEGLWKAFSRRAEDISEVRPEWGLANNAAFVAAPRRRTAGHNLQGRVFLHDYDPASDPDDRILNLILCAPVVVASWINLQYYGSRVDPERLGSGNKVLHNVVGGVGVVEGNGGDLRVGLPLQSIHDGAKFIHEPRRLSVFIEAETSRIGRVLDANPAVRRLFANGWIHLFAIADGGCHRFSAEGWSRFA